MENTTMIKGVALFATLTGIYQWLGAGTSLYDVLIIFFATFLIISMEPKQKEEADRVVHEAMGDNPHIKRNFFSAFVSLARRVPLRARAYC